MPIPDLSGHVRYPDERREGEVNRMGNAFNPYVGCTEEEIAEKIRYEEELQAAKAALVAEKEALSAQAVEAVKAKKKAK